MRNMDLTRMELSVIMDCIAKYTPDPGIRDVTGELAQCLASGHPSFEVFEACVQHIARWYPENLEAILSNPFAFYKESHRKNIPLIGAIAQDLAQHREEYQAYFAGYAAAFDRFSK